ncbi:complement C1q-like protein 4 [Ruditapes philippinarum]|uniref:complement C1q-like protein 4 n=1 Tax=Ruditapes philippinarum TaxID=129788 RepID=UPI00295B013F|nr:complement C1q-like protein 4 [Ruditapes philippinarum]
MLRYLILAVAASCFQYGSLAADVDQLQQEVNSLKSQMGQLQQNIHQMQTQLNASSALIHSTPHAQPIAFTAHLSKTIVSIQEHHHVSFDNVITNIGGAYNKETGHFVAPVFGTYAFFVTATNTPGHSTSLTLMKNGQWQSVTLAHGTASTPSQWETSTMCAMLLLNEGDEVWVQNEAKFSTTEDLDGYNYSSYSGFLIQRL